MIKKRVLLVAICCILLSMFNEGTAQQRNSIKENLFIQLPESVTLTPAENTARESAGTNTIIRSPFRSFDGTNNNLGANKRAWGSANIPLLREMPAVYGPNNSLNGSNRPSPREISNLVVDEPVTIFNVRNVSTVTYLWGQFLDHDITLTPTGTTESVPIPLPPTKRYLPSRFLFSEARSILVQEEPPCANKPI